MTFDENALNEPLPPSEWLVDGKPIKLEKIDDLTLKITSPRSLGHVLFALCHDDLAVPKHFWAKFHPRYNTQATYRDFKKRTTASKLAMQPHVPRLSAWAPIEWVHGRRLVYERNPWYWKIDTVGNQLPYADRLVFNIIAEPEAILLKFMNGEIDLFGRYARIAMAPFLLDGQKKGVFTVHFSKPSQGPALYPNWDAPNPALREAFRNRDVRIALSLALNRDEIGQIVFHGLLIPGGYAFTPDSPYYDDKAFHRFAEYNPAKAELNFPRRMNGEFDCYATNLNAGTEPLDAPHYWGYISPFTPFWHRNAAQEGPPWLLEATRYLNDAMTTVDPLERKRIMARVLALHSENIPVIGLGSLAPGLGLE